MFCLCTLPVLSIFVTFLFHSIFQTSAQVFILSLFYSRYIGRGYWDLWLGLANFCCLSGPDRTAAVRSCSLVECPKISSLCFEKFPECNLIPSSALWFLQILGWQGLSSYTVQIQVDAGCRVTLSWQGICSMQSRSSMKFPCLPLCTLHTCCHSLLLL